ncbi:MAG: ATP synthase epsilon chain [Parcubacteria group bacterium GW2011_GWA2_45_30]|nr:MAG: ATP synthase epsilon chain [Parcubacteria group bacterium GW2011_GWA2_45_30]
MRLAIYSIQKSIFEGEVKKLIARTSMGEITVLDNHIPLVSTLVGPSLSTIDKNGKKDIIPVSSGIIEVRPGSEVVVLA